MIDDLLLVSVVFSFRNERQNIPILINRLDTMFARVGAGYELIFVNDASNDGSLEALVEARRQNPRVKVVNMVVPALRAAGLPCASRADRGGSDGAFRAGR